MKYIVIDDEPIAHRIIEGYCDKIPFLEKVGNAYDAFEALEMLQENEVDLIFLDINMPKMNGFEMIRSLPSAPHIIVTSAYQQYALEGFELNVVDYLLKPFSFTRFLTGVNKIEHKKEPTKEQFFVKADKKLVNIDINDLMYIEAYGNYVKIVLRSKTVVCHQKLSYFDTFLENKGIFMRIHKSFIINQKYIDVIDGNTVVINAVTIPIGQKYKKELLSHL